MPLKVCGVRNLNMVQVCQDLSVPFIGFNFVPQSTRFINATQAQKLSHSFSGKKVGVFKNATQPEILETVGMVDLDIIQLHGEESPEFINQLQQALKIFKTLTVWKAFKIDENFSTKILQHYSKNCDLFLFDGSNPGSGQRISSTKKLAEAVQETETLAVKFALAGGINSQTLKPLRHQFPGAQLFDTASGVETNGQFERAKLKALLQILHDE